MGFGDIIFMALIFVGAAYMLYRTLFRKRGSCAACHGSAGKHKEKR